MIELFKVFMAPEAAPAVSKVLDSGYIGQGPIEKEFEEALKKRLDVPNLMLLNSCTSALQLAAYLAGVRPGTKVISTPSTCTASNTSMVAMGAEIIWSDIRMDGNIDPEYVDKILNEDVHSEIKAVVCVHWGGEPCDLDCLRTVCNFYNVKLIEDAAHAFGSSYKGVPIGGHSDYVCFSFQAIKHLTAGDGGALICKDLADHEQGLLLRWFGIDRTTNKKDFRCESDIKNAGWKYHMNDINASIGLANLPYMDDIVGAHKANAAAYTRVIADLEHITRLGGEDSASWVYTLLVQDRALFTEFMKEKGIVVSQVHARNDTHTMFADFISAEPLETTTKFFHHQISIPVGWWLSDDDLDYIINALREFEEYYDKHCSE